MHRRNLIYLGTILALFAFGLWVILPWGDEKLGRGPSLGLDLEGGTHLIYQVDYEKIDILEVTENNMEGVKKKIERRIENYPGITEPTIQRQGKDRILVQLPGIKDIDEAIRVIGKTAQLDFRERKGMDEEGNEVWVPAKGIVDGEEVELTGALLKPECIAGLGSNNQPIVRFSWNKEGAEIFEQVTKRNIGKPLGIFLDDERISAPTVRSVIKREGIIEGLTWKEAKNLRIQLNSGALDVPLKIIEQQDIDPTLGSDDIHKSMIAGIVGAILLCLFLILYYRASGVVACLALAIYAVLVLTIYKLVPVTLTLSGIAGFIISVGMAVDGNVLIFERMKEELRGGRTSGAALEAGFNRAWSAIRDSQVTTIIVCLILWWVGNSFGAFQIVGFAQTLLVGVIMSLFSAMFVSRTFMRLLVGVRLAQSKFRLSGVK